MFGDGPLAFKEFAMREPLPLATIQDAILLEFLRGRDDAVLFGSQAVNAYVDEARMTEDVDIMSFRAEELAEELREFLNKRFHIAVRVREIRGGIGYRIYQVRKPKNRHLVDVRPVEVFPPTQVVEEVLVASPADIVAGKVRAFFHRKGKKAKAYTDRRDIAVLLLTFPELKADPGVVRDRLEAEGAEPELLNTWAEIVAEDLEPEREEDKFDW